MVRRRQVLPIGLLVCGVLVASGAALHAGQRTTESKKPTVVFNITSGKEDLHAVTMALQLAGHAVDEGRNVVLFLNVRAPEFARKDLSDAFAFHGNPPLRKMIADLMARGPQVTVMVCPHCAEVMGLTEKDFAPGIGMASAESLFDKLGADSVVFTY